MKNIALYGKAVTGAVVAGLGALGAALSDGSVTPVEGVTIALAVVVGLGAVWSIPNADAPTPPTPDDDDGSDDQRGILGKA